MVKYYTHLTCSYIPKSYSIIALFSEEQKYILGGNQTVKEYTFSDVYLCYITPINTS